MVVEWNYEWAGSTWVLHNGVYKKGLCSLYAFVLFEHTLVMLVVLVPDIHVLQVNLIGSKESIT